MKVFDINKTAKEEQDDDDRTINELIKEVTKDCEYMSKTKFVKKERVEEDVHMETNIAQVEREPEE